MLHVSSAGKQKSVSFLPETQIALLSSAYAIIWASEGIKLE